MNNTETRRGRTHLNKSDKEEIRRRVQAGEPSRTIADWYNISEFLVDKIGNRLQGEKRTGSKEPVNMHI